LYRKIQSGGLLLEMDKLTFGFVSAPETHTRVHII
jgi:hypothetical protein